MSDRIIPDDIVLHLPEALKRHPDKGVIVVHRASEYGKQTGGRGTPELERKARAVFDAVRRFVHATPGKARVLRIPFFGVEKGRMSDDRSKVLESAAEWAYKHGSPMLVSLDLSRFIRAESYSRHNHHRDAWPLHAEFHKLQERMAGLILATYFDPLLTEDERHAQMVRFHGGAGRPRKHDRYRQLRAFQMLGPPIATKSRTVYANGKVAEVAERLGLKSSIIDHWLREKKPGEDKMWKKFPDPANEFMRYYLPELAGDPVAESPDSTDDQLEN